MTVTTRYGKITANKRTLNEIACDLYAAGDSYEKNGCFQLCLDSREVASQIHDALAVACYYTDIK